MARKSKSASESGWIVLLVDDDPDYLESASILLRQEGHTVLAAPGGPQALEILRESRVDLVLLDYLMPGMTGEEVVVKLREFNQSVQVILQTGYASEHPPRELLQKLDIQGYHDKSEGPDKFLLWVDVGLKAAYNIQLLNKSRMGLRYILEATPELHKIQPLEDLLRGVLLQITGLLGVVDSYLAVFPERGRGLSEASEIEGFLAMLEDDDEFVIRMGTGRFAERRRLDGEDPEGTLRVVRQVLQEGQVYSDGRNTVVPLRVGDQTIGVIFFARPLQIDRDRELLRLFANQASVAIQNALLYEMATLDPLTGVNARRFFEPSLVQEMRHALRARHHLSLLMVDLDDMKGINDRLGHQAGDQALQRMGSILRQATRSGDTIWRYGGDEFVVILPRTSAEGAAQVAQRILHGVAAQAGPDLPLRCSIGSGSLSAPSPTLFQEGLRSAPPDYFGHMVKALLKFADEALYVAKREGRNRLNSGGSLDWIDPVSSSDSSHGASA